MKHLEEMLRAIEQERSGESLSELAEDCFKAAAIAGLKSEGLEVTENGQEHIVQTLLLALDNAIRDVARTAPQRPTQAH